MLSYTEAVEEIRLAKEEADKWEQSLSDEEVIALMAMVLEGSREDAILYMRGEVDKARAKVDGMVAMAAAVYGYRDFYVARDVEGHSRRLTMDVPDAADRLGCTQDNIRQQLRRGTLGGEKRGGRWVVYYDEVERRVEGRGNL